MQIVGMIIGIVIAKYVLHLDSIQAIFPIAMIGWFIGLLMSGGRSGGASGDSGGGTK